jgi:hypothetical protein
MHPRGLQDPGRERVRPRQHQAGQRPAARVRECGGEHLDHRIRLDGRLGQVHDNPPAVEQLRTQRPPECRISRLRGENAPYGEDHVIVPVALPHPHLAAALGPAVAGDGAVGRRIADHLHPRYVTPSSPSSGHSVGRRGQGQVETLRIVPRRWTVIT